MPFYCNSCFCDLLAFDEERESPNTFKGYMTKCGHVFCGKCVEKSKPNCGHCRRPTQFRAIDKNMPSNLRQLFEPIESIIKQSCKSINFQTNLWNVTENRMRNEYSRLKQKGSVFQRKDRELAEENKAIELEIRKLLLIERKYKAFRSQSNRDPRAKKKHSPKRALQSRLLSHGKRRFFLQPSNYKDARPMSPRRLRIGSSFSDVTETTPSSRRSSPMMTGQHTTANRRPSGSSQRCAIPMNQRRDRSFTETTQSAFVSPHPPPMMAGQSTANRRPSGSSQRYAYAMDKRERDSGFSSYSK